MKFTVPDSTSQSMMDTFPNMLSRVFQNVQVHVDELTNRLTSVDIDLHDQPTQPRSRTWLSRAIGDLLYGWGNMVLR
jgi:hypothetical protein